MVFVPFAMIGSVCFAVDIVSSTLPINAANWTYLVASG